MNSWTEQHILRHPDGRGAAVCVRVHAADECDGAAWRATAEIETGTAQWAYGRGLGATPDEAVTECLMDCQRQWVLTTPRPR